MADEEEADKLIDKEEKRVADEKAKKPEIPGIGHNGPANVSGARLKSFLERIERLEAEKKALSDDIKDVYSETKSVGFDAKIIRKIVSLRKMNPEKRREERELLDLYLSAMGIVE